MDKPAYINTYFRIESGYDGGRMPEEKAGAFFAEVRKLFSEHGFSMKERKGGCPDVYLGKTRLYCHPQSLSGPVLKEHTELIEGILAQGTTFQYLRTDAYDEILDLTEEEELAYYHEVHDMTIGVSSVTPSVPNAATCINAGTIYWGYSQKGCMSGRSVRAPFIRTLPRHGVIYGRFMERWWPKGDLLRDVSGPLPETCRFAARQPTKN